MIAVFVGFQGGKAAMQVLHVLLGHTQRNMDLAMQCARAWRSTPTRSRYAGPS